LSFAVLLTLQGCTELPIIELPADSSGTYTESDLIIGVMRKRSLQQFEPAFTGVEEGVDYIFLDGAFLANYEVLEILKGRYSEPTIEFVAYDHYGRPAFSEFDAVMLYLLKGEEIIQHIKYEFLPVFELRGGGWAVCGEVFDLDQKPLLVPKPLKLVKPGPLKLANRSRSQILEDFPKKFFRHSRGQVYCTHGNSANEVVSAQISAGMFSFQ